jgi:Fur family ferric uptake transcriptional regulator
LSIVTRANEDPVDLLHRSGLHATPQRLAVLRVIDTRPHSTADQVERAVRAHLGTVSRQAVHDALNVLTERGLVRRIQPMRLPALYERRVGDNHHHLVCRSCGLVVDVDCAVGRRPCLRPIERRGFVVEEAEVIYWGVCANCSRTQQDGEESG